MSSLNETFLAAEIKKVLESLASSTDQEIIYGKCIKSGKSEIIICKTKEQWQDVKIEDENLNNLSRIIQGKVIKDKCSKDILVCQELKTTNCNDSPEDVEKYMKDLIRSAKIAPISTSVEVLVCNKLVCFDKKVHDTDKRELECRVLQVKELLGHTEPSTAHVKNSLDQAVSDESGTENTK